MEGELKSSSPSQPGALPMAKRQRDTGAGTAAQCSCEPSVRNREAHGIAFTLSLSVSCREPCVCQSRQPVATGNALHPISFLYYSLDIPHCISFSLG